MTRINLVDPSYLTSKHLMAEYRELPRVFTAVRKLADEGKTPANVDIPTSYVLGKGHVRFFYNKMYFLLNRYNSIIAELKRRNFKLDFVIFNGVVDSAFQIPNEWWDDKYKPTPEEIYLNMARLCVRSNITEVLMEITDA